MDHKYNISIIERDGAIGIIVSRGTHEIYRNMFNKNETDVSIKTDNINLEMNGFGVRKFSVSDADAIIEWNGD